MKVGLQISSFSWPGGTEAIGPTLARIVEATSRYLRDVGIQWGGDATFSPATGNPTGLAFPSAVGVRGPPV